MIANALRNWNTLCVGSVLVALGMAQGANAGTNYSDSFEAGSINSFWTPIGPGSATLSNSVAHSGSQSLKLTSSYPSEQDLVHDFGSEQQGSVSVYFHTEGGNFTADLFIRSGNGDWANIQFINPVTAATRVSIGGVQTQYSLGLPADPWQLFEIGTNSSGVDVKLNGATVLTDPRLRSFRTVSLEHWAGFSGSAYFDDFNANTTNVAAIPEPESYAMMLAGLGLLGAVARRRKQKSVA